MFRNSCIEGGDPVFLIRRVYLCGVMYGQLIPGVFEGRSRTYGVRLSFLSLHNSRFNDTLVMPEYRFNTLRPSEFTNFDVPTELVDFIFNIGIQTSSTQRAKERQNKIRQSPAGCVSYRVEWNVQRREGCFYYVKIAQGKIDSAGTPVMCDIVLWTYNEQDDKWNFIFYSLHGCLSERTVILD